MYHYLNIHISIVWISGCFNALVGPGMKEPEVRTHEYLQEVAIDLARYKAVHKTSYTHLFNVNNICKY